MDATNFVAYSPTTAAKVARGIETYYLPLDAH